MAYIKLLKENELAGGTDNTSVYPVSSTQAIYSQDEDGKIPTGVSHPKLEDRLQDIEALKANKIDVYTKAETDSLNEEQQNLIDAERARAVAAEQSNESLIKEEADRAKAAEEANAAAIEKETDRASSVEQNLYGTLNSEISRANSVETGLQSNISTEETRAKEAESAIQENLNAETIRAKVAEEAKVDKEEGKSLVSDSEIAKLQGLQDNSVVQSDIANAKAAGDNAQNDIDSHKTDKNNPHNVTKAQVGLGNVDNTADKDKPVSTATQKALDAKQDTLVSGENIKTINNVSLLGNGNITIDLTLYKVVDTLPSSGINADKIYLVHNTQTSGSNVYTEYMYVNSAWEVIGEYKSDVDLTPYAKTEDVNAALAKKADVSSIYTKEEVDTKITEGNTFDSSLYYTKAETDSKETALKATATGAANGMMSSRDKTKLDDIEEKAEANVIEEIKVDGTALQIENKAVNIDLSGKVDIVNGKGLSSNDYTTEEKTKVAGIEAGAEVNQNAYSTIIAGGVSLAADTKTDSIALKAGANVTITADTSNKTIIIASTDTVYDVATQDKAGLMSKEDKQTLDTLSANADTEIPAEDITALFEDLGEV